MPDLETEAKRLFDAEPYNHPNKRIPNWDLQPEHIKQVFRLRASTSTLDALVLEALQNAIANGYGEQMKLPAEVVASDMVNCDGQIYDYWLSLGQDTSIITNPVERMRATL